jgi:hypothetical protein
MEILDYINLVAQGRGAVKKVGLKMSLGVRL